MKTIKLLFICIFVSTYVLAQDIPPYSLLSDDNINTPKFKTTPNTAPKQSLNQYISANFVYPEVTGLAYEGTEVIQFIVNPSGKVSDFKIINSVSPLIDKEIVRVLKQTDNMWTPGYNKGIPVAMKKEIAVTVKTGETNNAALNKDFSKIARKYYTKGSKKLLIDGNIKRASKYFANAIRYNPYDKGLLFIHALCMAELGQVKSAKAKISRIEKLGGIDVEASNLEAYLKDLNSFEMLTSMLSDQ